MGDGDAAKSNQSYKLKKKPLTYLLFTDATNSWNLKSTLKIAVDGFTWQEVPDFYRTKEDDMVYIIRQDDEGESWVTFGDGIRGKRLPTGKNNVVGSYRYGAGATAPPALSIKQIIKPVKGLKSIENPCPAFGGQDRH